MKLDRIKDELLEFSPKFNHEEPHWREESVVRSRYRNLCDELHVSAKLFNLEFTARKITFRKNNQEILAAEKLMGKNLIVTDHSHWRLEKIVTDSLDRYKIEQQFRASKNPFQVRVNVH